jgi:hypothetical protein|tara:strand:+ start:788 stop:1129 length:342 start_codon:yes stop_codon:yes gene_type:complete
VVQASQNDFEEFGVDQSTLDEMKQVCDSLAEARLSHLPFRHGSTAQARQAPHLSFLSFLFPSNPFIPSSALRPRRGDAACSGVDEAAESGAELPAGFAGRGRLCIWVTSYTPC